MKQHFAWLVLPSAQLRLLSHLVAGYIAFISAQDGGSSVGYWGAGHGYLSQLVLLADSNPPLRKRSKKVAQESLTVMKTQKDRVSLKDLLPKDVF